MAGANLSVLGTVAKVHGHAVDDAAICSVVAVRSHCPVELKRLGGAVDFWVSNGDHASTDSYPGNTAVPLHGLDGSVPDEAESNVPLGGG